MPVRSRSSPPAKLRTAGKALQPELRLSLALDPILTMNGSGVIQSASDAVERVFGWTPTELYGRNVNSLIPEPRRSALDRYLDRYRNADHGKALQRTRRFDAVRKDGTVIQIELSVSRADLPPSSAPYFIGIVRDVSSQIDVGPSSADDRSRLQQLITEQTRALASANLRLQLADRLASLGTLAAGLGHDMNNVLLPVRARLNALEHGGITPSALSHVRALRRSVAYLQHLSDALHFLALDPEGSGMAAGGSEFTNLTRWWRQVGTLLEKAVPRRVTLRASFPASLPAIAIAPHWLTQVMLNLVVNAGEAIPDRRRHGLVRVFAQLSHDGRTVRVAVSDNGRGMEPAIRRRAFDLFFTTKRRGMGTGLGLPLAKKVLVRVGGELELESVPGKGTTAVLVVPVAGQKAVHAPHVRPDVRVATATIRDKQMMAIVTQLLVGAGILLRTRKSAGPGSADVWITDAATARPAVAARWLKGHPRRTVIVLGTPKGGPQQWDIVGTTLIEPADDFEALRHALIGAAAPLRRAERKGKP